MEVSCLLNSALHIVPQSLALSNSFIHVFGWTSFPYPTALETSDATCPYSLECPLHGSVTWHQAPEKLASYSPSSWLSSQITAGQLETSFFGGPAGRVLGRIQALLRNCQVQFFKEWHICRYQYLFPKEKSDTFLSLKSLGTISGVRAIYISDTEMIINT